MGSNGALECVPAVLPICHALSRLPRVCGAGEWVRVWGACLCSECACSLRCPAGGASAFIIDVSTFFFYAFFPVLCVSLYAYAQVINVKTAESVEVSTVYAVL